MEQNVVESMRRVFLNVQTFEKEFVRKQMECYSEDKKKELAAKRKELGRIRKRIGEIDGLVRKIYEDNAKVKISDERFAVLCEGYEAEQQELKTVVPELEAYLESETDRTENLHRFVEKVKRITEPKELSAEMAHEFIERIVVYAPKQFEGKRVQLMDIYYNGVGILRELSPEEMEEAFGRTGTHKCKDGVAFAAPSIHLNLTTNTIIFVTEAALGHLPYGGCPNVGSSIFSKNP